MKFVRFFIISSMVLISANLFAQVQKTDKIKVSGNCEQCKKHIETASKAQGVSSAEWNKKTMFLTVTYNPAKTSSDEIQKNIAAAGYDTEKYKGDDKAYNNLDECCQYNRKKINDKKE